MNESNTALRRAQLLFQQDRNSEAEREVRNALTEDPDDAAAHALLSMCFVERDALDDAERECDLAIGLAPQWGYPRFARARVKHARKRPKEAIAAIDEAIDLDPDNAFFWGFKASLLHGLSRHADSLAAAEQGLQADPEDETCLNFRAMALRSLGRRDEAASTIAGALERNPEDALAHANLGWNAIHSGQPRAAFEHFREALRLRPGMEYAREGMIEALRGRYVLYRPFLWYFAWMSRLSERTQWSIVIGGYIAYVLARNIARHSPALAPFLWPIVGAYIAFAAVTWFSRPMFNCLLMTNRFGRLALTRREKVDAGILGSVLLLALAAAAVWLISGDPKFAGVPIYIAVLAIPIGSASMLEGRGATVMWAFALLMAVGSAMAIAGLLMPSMPLWARFALSTPLFALLGTVILNAVIRRWLS